MNTRGYTILEAMIFLAVSAALFVTIAGLFNGRIQQAQFTTAVQELDAQIRSVITETAAGYYPNQGDIKCSAPGPSPSTPVLSTVTNTGLGTNGDCVFIGKVFQFGVNGTGCTVLPIDTSNCDTINVFSMVAKNPTLLGTPPSGYQTVNPLPIAPRTFPAPAGYPDDTQTIKLTNGLHIKGVYNGTPPANQTAVTAFFLPLAAGGLLANTASGQELNQRVVLFTNLGTASHTMANTLSSAAWDNTASTGVNARGVTVCVESSNDRKAAIVIGGQGHATSTEVIIDGGGCP